MGKKISNPPPPDNAVRPAPPPNPQPAKNMSKNEMWLQKYVRQLEDEVKTHEQILLAFADAVQGDDRFASVVAHIRRVL